ncbi:MAG: tape measure protein, partial [Aquabacterium sp.]
RETTALYTRMLNAVRPLGGGLREANVGTTALLASLKLSGASAAEAGSAILQFSQALGAGALRGEEFNSIAEAAPTLLDALARGLGKGRDQLRGLAEQGQLTTAAVVGALSRELPRLQREAASMGDTIGGATLQVKDSMLELVGASAQGSQGVATVVGALKLLAENLGLVMKALALLAAGIVAVKIGQFAGAIQAAGVAAAAAVPGVTGFGVAARGVLALIGGPVGLIVAIGSLAAAWGFAEVAAAKAGKTGVDRLREQLKAAKDLENRVRNDAQAEGVDAAGRQYKKKLEAAAAVIAKLEVQIAAAEAEAADADREAQRFAGAADREQQPLREGAAYQTLLNEFKTREIVEREFAKKRENFLRLSDSEIARAREAGDLAAVKKLEGERTGFLQVIARDRAEALNKFDEQGQLTRLAQAQKAYDANAELAADALQRELDANQTLYDRGLRDLEQYMAERARIEDRASALKIDKLQAEVDRERAALTQNEELLKKRTKPNDRAEAEEAIARSKARVAELEVQIAIAQRDQAAATEKRSAAEIELQRLLGRDRAQLAQQEAQFSGADLSREDIRALVLEQFGEQLKRFGQAGDQAGVDRVLKLVDAATTRRELEQVQRDFTRVRADLDLQEEAIRQKVQAGQLLEADAEAQILALRRQNVPVLDAILERMAALAQSPEERQAILKLKTSLQVLKDTRADFDKLLASSATSGLTQFLNDVSTGAKTAGQALRDMVSGFARAMLNALNQKLAERLVKQFLEAVDGFKASGGGGGGGGILDGLFKFVLSLFHTGGVVGAGGGMRRAVPLAAMLAFAQAPMYHSGGIAGLAPNEVPAVLEAGEEVLTTDDPRHIRNIRRGGGAYGGLVVQSSVTVNGAQGSDQDMRGAAQDLDQRITSVTERWAAEQLRPGGILARA